MEEGEIGIKKGREGNTLKKENIMKKREKLCVVTSHVFQPMPKQALVMTVNF